MRQISLCLTNYNRYDMLIRAFEQLLDDDRVSEIVISDDASDWYIYERLQDYANLTPKVRLFRNLTNRDCYQNKMVAISLAINEWVIIGDSDNVFTKDYVDKLFEIKGWVNDVAYMPAFAKPHFDYRQFKGHLVDKYNIKDFMEFPIFRTLLNCMNYFVNRSEYLKVWDGSIDPVTSDSIFQNYNWLKAGNKIYVLEGLEYEHTIHNGSHYQNNVNRTPKGFHESIEQKLKELK